MKALLKRLLRQPILHFLFLGGGIFALYEWSAPEEVDANGNRIVVDRGALLTFVQYRNRAFNEAAAETYLSQLSSNARQQLIEDMVREEALYREAQKLRLDRDDYVIKRRLVQKMEYLARGFGPSGDIPGEQELAQFYEANRERYRETPSITFTHVFIDEASPGPGARARALLTTLRKQDIPFAASLEFGDRFLYHRNYVERDPDFIASHFGEAFARKLLETDGKGEWIGPFSSEHGLHLVMVADRESGGIPPLEAVRSRVARDAVQERLERHSAALLREVVSSYDVVISKNLGQLSAVNASDS